MNAVARNRFCVVLAALTLLILTACGPLKAGSAAIVGDSALSEQELADIATEVADIVDDSDAAQTLPADQVNVSIVGLWVDEELVEALAANEGAAVSQGDVDRFLERFDDQARADIAVQAAIPPSQLERAARNVLLRQQLGQLLAPDGDEQAQAAAVAEALLQTADGLHVSINPRFGSWNADTPGVEPRDESRLSEQSDADPELVDPLAPVGP